MVTVFREDLHRHSFCILADTVAIFTILKWELGIVEAIIVIMSVGLSVDFVVHFGVGYIHADSNDIDYERKRVKERYLTSTNESNRSSKTLRESNRTIIDDEVFSSLSLFQNGLYCIVNIKSNV